MKIRITADSTCDLSQELVEKYNIGVIPLFILRGEKMLRDGVDIVPQDIYDYVESGAGVCSTCAVNAADYQDFFRQQLEEYDAVIHVNISSDFSVCYQNATLAAAELENVFTVDSRNLSTGTGHIALLAAELAAQSAEPAEIKRICDERTAKVNTSFVLDTLKYLHKGGRCSGVAALGANLLNLRPCIEVRNGKMEVGKKYRGSIEKVLVQYVKDRLEGRDDIDLGRIFITDSGIDPKIRELVHEAVASCGDFKEILHTRAGCTVSSHCGPKCLGILYFMK